MNNRLSLINYEGDCLWAIPSMDNRAIVVYDQHDSLCEIMPLSKFLDFLDGNVSITDSEGKEWYYPNEHRDAKPTNTMVYNFIKHIQND